MTKPARISFVSPVPLLMTLWLIAAAGAAPAGLRPVDPELASEEERQHAGLNRRLQQRSWFMALAKQNQARHELAMILDSDRNPAEVVLRQTTALRIIQVLPKTTSSNDKPRIGISRQANARAVLGTVPVEADGTYKVAYWHEIGAYQNQAPPAGQFGNHSAYIHVWNEDGSPRAGADIYTSWGVLLGRTDGNGFFELPLTVGYDFQIRDGSRLSETTPVIDVRRMPNWGHYSWEIGFLLQSNPDHSLYFNTNHAGTLNASGTEPCRDLSAPGTLSLAYRSTPTNYCGDAFSLGNWANEHGQTFVATGNRVVAAKIQGTIGFLQQMNFTAQILESGPNGTPVGPPKTSRTMVSDEYFPILIKWNVNDVQVVPGRLYYLKITRGNQGLNAYQVGNTYAQGQYFENGVAQPGKDLMGLVVCMNYTPTGPAGAVEGVVRDTGNNPLRGVTVATAPRSLYAITIFNGSYAIPDVPAGLYDITASKPGYISQTIGGVAVSTGTTAQVNFNLMPQPTNNGSIAGLVVDPKSNPLDGVQVTVYPTNLTAMTGTDGQCLFPSVSFGAYQVVASKLGFASAVQSGVMVTNGQTTSIQFMLLPQALRNGNFESGFSNSIGNHWTKFTMSGGNNATYIEESQQKWGGRRAQRWWTSYGTHHAGIYQQIPAVPNSNYTFSAWTWRSDPWDNGAINQEMWVGIDPSGGTNPNSAAILWSNGEHSYRSWTRQSAAIRAQAGQITVFVRGRAHFAGSAMLSVVDDAVLSGPAPAPLGLTAQPGNQQVTLAWYENIPGALFNLKRAAAAGGPYAAVARDLAATSFTDLGLANGVTYHYAVSSVIAGSEGPDSPPVSATPTSAIAMVPFGSTWKYLDDGSNQGSGWRSTDFDDRAWSAGPARLGYGGDGEIATVSYGAVPNNKHVTTYFRHTFRVTNKSLLANLTLDLVRDDGGVVHLNGAEIFRSNMPQGPIAFNTLASSTVSGSDEFAFHTAQVDPGLLVDGANVLAVEIHQASADSSDLGFDLRLVGDQLPGPPILVHRRLGNRILFSWLDAPGFVLQGAGQISPGTVWTNITTSQTSYLITIGDQPAFFRLRR